MAAKVKKAEEAPVEEKAEHIPDWKDVHGLRVRDDFDMLVAEHIALAAGVKESRARQAEIVATLQVLVDAAGVKTVLVALEEDAVDANKARVTRVADGVTKKINPTLLLKNGVSAATIAKSTEETPRKGFLKITAPGEKEAA